jgi:hypothetical protein
MPYKPIKPPHNHHPHNLHGHGHNKPDKDTTDESSDSY